jgi:hypothetical protein
MRKVLVVIGIAVLVVNMLGIAQFEDVDFESPTRDTKKLEADLMAVSDTD